MSNPNQSDLGGPPQTIFDHLAELRFRLINSLWAIVLCTVAVFYFADQLLVVLRKPIQPYLPQGGLIYTAPIDKFMAYVKIAFVAGVILSCPIWMYQAWKFVAPGLYKKEKNFALTFILSGTSLFLAGVSFAYFVVLPTAFHFLMTFGNAEDKPMITIDSYLSFIAQIMLMFGLVFEMPLILTTLSLFGVVTSRFLREKRRFAIMIMAVASALITPPDAMSMVMMLGPMWALYEISILLVAFVEKRKRQEESSSKDLQI